MGGDCYSRDVTKEQREKGNMMGNVQVLKVQVENAIKNGDVVSFDYVDRYGVESHRANVEFEQHMGANLYAGFDQEREGYRRFYLEDMTDFKVKQV